jgi:hypothetical protein
MRNFLAAYEVKAALITPIGKGVSAFNLTRIIMTYTWEIADEDISIVIASHKAKAPIEAARAAINESKIIEALNRFDDFAEQVASASSDIEDQLMAAGLIPPAVKKFEHPYAGAVK